MDGMITTQRKKPVKVSLKTQVNRHFRPIFDYPGRYVFCKGGAASGKSHAIAQKLITRAAAEKKQTYIALRKARPYVKLSCYPLIKNWLDKWGIMYKENKTDLSFTIQATGSKIECMGLDEPEKIKSVEECTAVWMEEMTEFTKRDFIQLDLRMRGLNDYPFQLYGSFNPISRMNWVYKELYEQKMEDALYHESTYKNNQFLDPYYKKRLRRLIDEDRNYYDVYALNLWGELQAIIYSNWEVRELAFSQRLPNHFDFLIGGLDYGYYEPSAFSLIGIKDRVIYVIDEVYENYLTNQQFITKVKEKFVEWGLFLWDVPLFSDNEPDRIQEFQEAGFACEPADKKNVWNQIDFIKRFKIIINTACPFFRKEIETYKAKEDKATGLVYDQPVKFKDHLMDAFRYAVYSMYLQLAMPGEGPMELIFGGKSHTKGLIHA